MTELTPSEPSFIIDGIVVTFLLFSVISGWRRGFLQTLIGPLSLILCFFIAEIYFLKTHRLIIAFLIFIFGPMTLTILLSSSLTLWNKTVDGRLPLVLISRFLGSVFNLSWGGLMIALLLIGIVMIPANLFPFRTWQEKTARSHFYSLIEPFFKKHLAFVNHMENMIEVSQDAEKLTELQSTPEFAVVYNDEKIQEILADKETYEQMKNKDILKLITNPKILALWEDQVLIEKMIKLKETMEKQGVDVVTSSEKNKPQ